ncbi:MAG TPA: class I SAM-dependent methyltransferase [Candidatus Binatia bacterium]|nr:class I SAM-dependent methyltransferase [Candidatus Binatia bacterium]
MAAFSHGSSRPFAGTAIDYARYRPPYPDAFLADLRARAETSGRGSLLDLACGPGRVAIPMAPHFSSVLAVDVEPDMIAVGEAEARRRGAGNISWLVERAESLALPPRSIELITIGEAFHRLDAERMIELMPRWLRPRGSVATLGADPVWRGSEEWKRAVVDVVNRWTGQALGNPNEGPGGGPVDELRAAGLEVEEREWVFDWIWTCDSIVGFMFATSIASRRLLGDQATAFEADLRRALLECEPSGRFPCRQKFSFTVGRKLGGDR